MSPLPVPPPIVYALAFRVLPSISARTLGNLHRLKSRRTAQLAGVGWNSTTAVPYAHKIIATPTPRGRSRLQRLAGRRATARPLLERTICLMANLSLPAQVIHEQVANRNIACWGGQSANTNAIIARAKPVTEPATFTRDGLDIPAVSRCREEGSPSRRSDNVDLWKPPHAVPRPHFCTVDGNRAFSVDAPCTKTLHPDRAAARRGHHQGASSFSAPRPRPPPSMHMRRASRHAAVNFHRMPCLQTQHGMRKASVPYPSLAHMLTTRSCSPHLR